MVNLAILACDLRAKKGNQLFREKCTSEKILATPMQRITKQIKNLIIKMH